MDTPMDTTFITIHDLSDQATILYSSDSIVDILGHTPDEVVNRSCWEFFHPEDLPVAKKLHSRGVRLDKAAVLAYCRIKNRRNEWVGCECCFSIVYDVMVCCTSIYHHGPSSQKRAAEAPLVRRLFTATPKDPRYHMLSHLCKKFDLGPEEQTHEPRAALFLNRFTRTLTIMYATSGIEQIIGISGADMRGRSFYYCIQENCLEDAVRCLETAKGNDSIAYMRFFFRDPRQDDQEATESSASEAEDEDDIMTDVDATESESEASTGGGSDPHHRDGYGRRTQSVDSNASSLPSGTPRSASLDEPIELEAVVSCTSDGLVVCLRRARIPFPAMLREPAQNTRYPSGIFAAPWAPEPMFVPNLPQQPQYPLGAQHPAMALTPQADFQSEFMKSIRDVAVFAWALTGINGCLAEFGRNKPEGESLPPDGFPVWAPDTASSAPSGYGSGSSTASWDPNESGRGAYGDLGF